MYLLRGRGCLQEQKNMRKNLSINYLELMSLDVTLNTAKEASI